MNTIRSFIIALSFLMSSAASYAQGIAPVVSTTTWTSAVRSLAARGTDVFNPKDFGAIGDGSSHPIGTTYGASLSAIAAFVTQAGATPFSWVTNAAYGLTFSMNTTAAQGSPGTALTFQTTVSGINGWSATIASFNGLPATGQNILIDGMNVTGSCVAANTTVSTFAISTGVVTLSQNTSGACGSGTAITFSLTNAQVQALQADFLGIQSAVAAAAQSVIGGTVHISQGNYVVNRPVWNPGINNGSSVYTWIDFTGDGDRNTILNFTTDLGAGSCALGEANRGVASAGYSTYRGFYLIGPGTSNTVGNPVAGMDGLCMGSKDVAEHIYATEFHAGISLLEDHGSISRSNLSGNFYGIYFAANGDTIGNWNIEETILAYEAWSGIGIAWNNSINYSYLKDLDIGTSSPYAIYREAVIAGHTLVMFGLNASTLVNLFGEGNGNGFIYEETSSDEVNGNTFINVGPTMSGNTAYQIPGRTSKAVIYTGGFLFNVMVNTDFSFGGGNNSLVADAIVEGQEAIQGNQFGFIPNEILNATTDFPILKAPTILFDTFEIDRASGEFRVAEAGLTNGEVVAYGQNAYDSGAAAMAVGLVPLGIVQQTVTSGQVAPVITRGLVAAIKTTDVGITQGQPVAASRGTPTSVTAATNAATMPIVGTLADAGNVASGTAIANIDVRPTVASLANAAATKFTASGCSISATSGGATSGTYTSGTSGTCTAAITMNGATGLTAPNGWVCSAFDRTTAADAQLQTVSSATGATIAGTTVSGDIVAFSCQPY